MSALGALAAAALTYCPSYTASSPNNTGSCAVEAAPGPNPSLADWQTLFAQVAQGPAGWGASGPSVSNFTVGCNQPSTPASRPPRFPCELVKAIAYQESLWQHFCVPDRPADQVGGASRTIIAVDCGYGVAQVTSGMRTFDPTPSFDRARVASSPLYNLATGMQILRDKWQVVACVGDRQPQLVEHWYSATWAYNGLSAVNSPNNANYSTTRGPWNPSVGGNVPYQERVWGRMQFPPSSQHWPVLLAGYPSLLDVGTGTRPNALPDPVCGSPTSCATTRPIHTSTCLGAGGSGGGAGGAGGTGGAGGSAGAGGSGGSGGTGGTAGSGGTGGIGGTGGGAPVEPDAGRPDVTLPSAQDRLWPAAGCGCQAVDVDVALLLAGLGLRRRRRLAPRR